MGCQAAGEDAVVGGLDAAEEADAGGEHGGATSPWRRDGSGWKSKMGLGRTCERVLIPAAFFSSIVSFSDFSAVN
jgi:hypothetical protein